MKTKLNMTRKRSIGLLASIVVAAALMVPNAFAAVGETNAGATISNMATVSYSVATVPQTGVDSNIAAFLVDHKVRPFVDNAVGANAVPGGSTSYLTFTLTNDGNTDADALDTLELQLTAVADGGNPFAVTEFMIYRESQVYPLANGLDGADVLISNYSLPGPTTLGAVNLLRDETVTIYVVATMDAAATNGQTASVHLIATAWNAGSALEADSGGDSAMGVAEVVFADDAGTAPGDGQYGGQHSLNADFTIASAVLGVTKSSTNLGDPYGTNYHVPGATVQYTITIANTGPAAATGLQVVDQIPDGTDFVIGTIGSSLDIDSIQYSNEIMPVLPTWGYTPLGLSGAPDPAVTWIRINLNDSVPPYTGLETAQFNVVIE